MCACHLRVYWMWKINKRIELFNWQFNCLHFNCSTDCKNIHTHNIYTYKTLYLQEEKKTFGLSIPFTVMRLVTTTHCQCSVSWYLCQDINFRFHIAHLQIDSQINHWKLVALFIWCVSVCVFPSLLLFLFVFIFVIAATVTVTVIIIIIHLVKCLPESLTMQIVVTNNVKTQ